MLRSVKELDGLAVEATDGTIGRVKDVYFDDAAWVVRYLVVETGSWLSSRKVLISPISMGRPDWAAKTLPVSITREQVKSSPDIDTERPVSRQHEAEYLDYYGYPSYGGGRGIWGEVSDPSLILPGLTASGSSPASHSAAEGSYTGAEAARKHEHDQPRLRSCQALMGYRVHATDDEVGHVHGFLLDERTWAIRYVIVNTSDWWLGHEVNIAREWIKDVRWSDASITVDRTREAVKDALLDEPSGELDREQRQGPYSDDPRPDYETEVPRRETRSPPK
jgi:sporulation protein YlmC with PRC-barrel domain